MICPDFFGCSGKLTYRDTRKLASAASPNNVGRDFSSLTADGAIASSIDRVHRCAKDWDQFARIAINHAFGDVVCAGATPVQAMISFEFGIDVGDGEETLCSEAFARELAIRGVALGKCHSCRTETVTAVTIATLGANPTRLQAELETGHIYLSRKIGALKAKYLVEIGAEISAPEVPYLLEKPSDETFRGAGWTLLTDVSGHGMLGAVGQIAQAYNLKVELELGPDHAILPEVLLRPVECLQNSLNTYDVPLGSMHPSAEMLITLRETAGPFVGFLEGAAVECGIETGILIGRYRKGETMVNVEWSS